MVLSKIGKKAPMKVMNTMLCSAEANSRMASGIQATAGMGRKISSGGGSDGGAPRKRSGNEPRSTQSPAASEKPRKLRRTLLPTCAATLGAAYSSANAAATSVGAGMFSKRKKKFHSCTEASCHSESQSKIERAPIATERSRREMLDCA